MPNKHQFLILAALALSLRAAEPWESKPFTAWTDEEIHGLLSNSPWAHQITFSETYSDPVSEGSGGGRKRGGGGGGFSGVSSSTPRMILIVLWESALPVRQGLLRLKYGAEVAATPDAKEFLDRGEPNYNILITGLPASAAKGDIEKEEETIRKRTALRSKGKMPVLPLTVEVTVSGQAASATYQFPRTATFTPDDQEVEFSTKIAGTSVSHKFHLKDMVFHGNLEL